MFSFAIFSSRSVNAACKAVRSAFSSASFSSSSPALSALFSAGTDRPPSVENASFLRVLKTPLVGVEAGAGVDWASSLGASVVFSVSVGVVGVSVTCAAAVVADASGFPADPLSPDEFPPLLVVGSDWCVFWLPVAGDTTLSAACTLPFPKNNNDATATLAAPKWNLRIEYFVIFSGCDLFLLNLNLICFLL